MNTVENPPERLLSRVQAAVLTSRSYFQTFYDWTVVELDRFAAFLNLKPGIFVAWFSIIYFVGVLGRAYHQKLWLDEIISAYLVQLPAVHDLWTELLNTVDGNPPLYYLMARPFLRFFGATMAIRLPAVLGFWVAAMCVFVFMRRNTSTAVASVATLIFAETGALRWAIEGRPYGVVLGLTGVAVVLWQRCANDARYRGLCLFGVAATMACLVSTHYYSALIVVPLLLGELIVAVTRRRLDWPLYIAIAAGSAAILLWTPLLRGLRANVAGNAASMGYFAEPSIAHLWTAYETLAGPLIVPLLACLVFVFPLLRNGHGSSGSSASKTGSHEIAVVLGLACFPAIVLAAALLVTKTFVARYVLAGALGMAMLVGLVLHQIAGQRRAVIGLTFLIIYGYFSYTMMPLAVQRDDTYDSDIAFLDGTNGKMPIVVAEGLLFAPLWYYAPKPLRSRLVYVTDLATAERVTDTTNENIMLRLKPWAPQAIVPLGEFVSRQRTFLLYYVGVSGNSSLNALLDRKCAVRLEKKEGSYLLFQCDCR